MSRAAVSAFRSGAPAALNFLAESYLKLGNLAMARRLAKEALEKRLRHLGADHPDTVESNNLLAQCE